MLVSRDHFKMVNTMTKPVVLSLSALALVITLQTAASAVSAQACGQYGTSACPPTDLTINKQVRNPITGVFVENLVDGDAAYSPNTTATYMLKITNSGNTTFNTVQVTDTVPDKMTNPKVSDSDKDKVTNVTNPDNRTITFVLKDALRAGETREVKIEVTIGTNFGSVKTCSLVNTARVTADDRSNSDSAALCVITSVSGSTTLPKAGPEDYLPLLPFLGTGITGLALFLKRR